MAATPASTSNLVDVLEKDPAIEAAAFGPLASGLEFDVFPRHAVCRGQRPEYLQHIG